MGCANHPSLQLRAKLNYEDAAQPDRVEGFLRAPLAATLCLMSDHGARLDGRV